MSPRRSSLTTARHETKEDAVVEAPNGSASVSNAGDQELAQKYRSLKRRYNELGEEASTESQRSEERNVKMRDERSLLLDSITSLENDHPGIQDASFSESPLLQSNSGSMPVQSSNVQPYVTSDNTRNHDVVNGGEMAAYFSNGEGTNASSSSSPPSSHIQTQQSPLTSSSRAPASGPSRPTRRSSRVASADHGHVQDSFESSSSKMRAKRSPSSPTAKARLTRSETAALAAAAAQAAQAEAATSSTYTQLGKTLSSISSLKQSTSASSSSLPSVISGENVSQSTHSDSNIDPALVNTESNGSKQPEKEPSPMDNIVKVAEAAIAAQLAANNSQAPSSAPSTSASPAPSQTPSATSTSTDATARSSSKPYNPYMITTQMKLDTGAMSPLSMNPYAMYYGPGTPITPGASPYSPYPNPYYYLTSPMAGPSGMYPLNANFPQPNTQQSPPKNQPQTKPKRLKAHTVTTKSFSIPVVPRDKQGQPMLPLNVGIMTVISLGEVCMREHFHTERYIFPVGYEVTRRYLSTIDPTHEVVYHCTILDGGDGPKFQIVPSDVPDRPVIAGTATGAWSSIVKQANAIRNRQHSNSVSGPDFFGLGQNTIKHLIQELPNAGRLRDYVWQKFNEGGPLGGRHAAVIPALPEEYDASMPIGAYYPTPRDKRKQEASNPVETPTPKGISHYPQHIIAQAEAQRAQQHALQQAQQMAVQPLQPTEPSGTNSQQPVPQPPAPQIDTSLMNFQEYRHPVTNPGTSDGSTTEGTAPPVTSSPPVPATFASIMNAFPAGTGSSAPTPAQ
ncbi:hypothetical protein H0H87_002660 [Tephrocybe sp. NHM501043]|nr:hypothetical protein H0H87_002660 [Tephrocybe sp. NHM501043]